MELGSVVAATVAAEGLSAAWQKHFPTPQRAAKFFDAPSHVVAVSANPAQLRAYTEKGWTLIQPDAAGAVAPWTDDYSNVVAAILRMQGLL
jgi:hypothetical protein